ncbi:MAG: glyoxal/methylglyoxal reductase [Acidimicrobiia bacterium]|nr:MAG: glyoxal/methylglyoxal reductase [Acidimicrobiia bacterium]
MTISADTVIDLHGDSSIPQIGLGVFKADRGSQVENAVAAALESGYRHIDTATIYRNEEGVGNAIAASGIDRDDVFVTTKLWNSDQGYESALAALDASLGRLGMDYVDLYLVHWPKPEHTADTWRAMEELRASGKARAIGVSNFLQEHLDQLSETATLRPSINQIEFHPHLQSPELVSYCKSMGIVVEAWSPLKHGEIVKDPDLVGIADAHGVTAAQVTLRWMLQKGIVTIPKSVTPSRIAENLDLYGFTLDDIEMNAIDALDRNDRVGPDPADFDF